MVESTQDIIGDKIHLDMKINGRKIDMLWFVDDLEVITKK